MNRNKVIKSKKHTRTKSASGLQLPYPSILRGALRTLRAAARQHSCLPLCGVCIPRSVLSHRKSGGISYEIKKAASIGMTAALAAALTAGAIPVYAADSSVAKEDTVYILADASGFASEATVSSHLILDGKTGSVEDRSDLDNIINVKGDETFTDADGHLVWNAEGSDIYYQGTTGKEAPVAVQLTYFLDGKEISPSELSGKSGHLVIRVRYENRSDISVGVDGTQQNIKTPFLMMTGLVLPSETFSDVSIDSGRIVNTASGLVAVGYGMPGLKESLKLDEIKEDLEAEAADDFSDDSSDASSDDSRNSGSDSEEKAEKEETEEDTLDLDTSKISQKLRDRTESLQISDSFEVEADVNDFSLGSTYTFAFSDLFSELDTGDFFSIEDINDAMDKIKEAGTKLADGSGELYDGSSELNDGYSDLDDGIKTLKSGIGELAKGTDTLKEGAEQYVEGTNTLSDGVIAYVKGVEQVADGVNSLSDLQEGIDQLKDGIGTLASSASKNSELVKGITALDDGMSELNKTFSAIDINKLNQLLQDGSNSLQAAGIRLDEVIQTSESLESAGEKLSGLIKQIDQLEAGIQSLCEAQNTTFEQTKAGAIQVADGTGASTELKSGLVSGVKGKLPATQFKAAEADHISISIEGLTEEQQAQLDEAVAQANENIDNVNDANQKMAATATGVLDTAVNSAVEASVTTTASTIHSVLDEKLQNSGKAQVEAGASQMISALETLKGSLTDVSARIQNVTGSASYQNLKKQIPELKQTLSGLAGSDPVKKLGELQSGVSSLAVGTASLKSAVNEKLIPGIAQLNSGAKKLSKESGKGITALQKGAKKLTSNDKALKDGAKTLKKSGKKLTDGVAALSGGAGQLDSGAYTLSTGSDTVKEGIGRLNDGAGELHDALKELDEKGIQKVADLVEGDMTDFFNRIKAVSSPDAVYTNFSGAADGMDSSVRFVIETESIE